MRDNKAIGALSGVAALSSAVALVYSVSGGLGPHINASGFETTGQALARQTLAFLKPAGHVTVITRDTVAFQNPASDRVLSGFRRELARGGVKIDTFQAIQIDPLRPTMVPAGDFLQWIKKASANDVLVSFMGPPLFNDAQVAQLGEVKPAIVAFCPGPTRDQVDLRALFARGLLRAAVVSKRPTAVSPGTSASGREIFDRQFVEVTAANLSNLPLPLTSSP